ncbi:hypothetical protein SSX86_010398 [Deinandra increscens subsp. villosa]|uniref:Non-specific lipid-transfer protein n=1 Tax=Deinandra increscens subsp. villosa TaxID=3103831 RepID=A0AAP0D7G7_9ASTR
MAGHTMKVLCIIVACMAVAEALTCSDVDSDLSPCLNYLENGGSVSSACCSGVKKLNKASNTTALKKTACNCMKSAYKSMSSKIKIDNASSLPKKCNVNIPYKISPDTNCNTLK